VSLYTNIIGCVQGSPLACRLNDMNPSAYFEINRIYTKYVSLGERGAKFRFGSGAKFRYFSAKASFALMIWILKRMITQDNNTKYPNT